MKKNYYNLYGTYRIIDLVKFGIMIIFIINNTEGLNAQNDGSQQSTSNEDIQYTPIINMEYDTRHAFSVQAGVVRIKIHDCPGKICLSGDYQQLYAKYNFIEKAIGIQATYGTSALIIGGRVGIDYEYSLKNDKGDFSSFVLAGFDGFGMFSLVIGPKFNFTRNNSKKYVTFQVSLDLTPLIIFGNQRVRNTLF